MAKHCNNTWQYIANIEIVNNYTYLGVKFSANGNFTNHKENLTEKTKRSFVAARRYLEIGRAHV